MSSDDLPFPQFKSTIIKGLSSRNIVCAKDDLYECKLWGTIATANVPRVGLIHYSCPHLMTEDERSFWEDTSKPADPFARKFQLALINDAVKARENSIRGGSKECFVDVAKKVLDLFGAYMNDDEVRLCSSVMSSTYSAGDGDRLFLLQKKYELY